ncbi:MAG: hypothetical protein HY959_07350 [Ignavibacteriae bacterium]|nr:hypothetical protein [Ignavibacteriota bacterium]
MKPEKRTNIFFIRIISAVLFFYLFPGLLFPQGNPNYKSFVIKLTFQDTVLRTGDKFIIQGTDSLRIDRLTLIPKEDFTLNYRNGEIYFSRDLFRKYSLDTTRIYDLNIQYDLFPFALKDEYSNFDIIIERDTLTGDTVQVATQRKDVLENLFEGSSLEKSGSIFRGVTIGSNRDLTLNSGFRLQLNGKLTKDIDLTAALTDENTPIQPEGNTLKLQELDKVFIEIKSSTLGATIGDIDLSFPRSEFLNFSRKIQGARGFGEFDFGKFLVTGAISKGKFSSNSFSGSDGVQGPYRLTGANNEINILVLSGTEKVFIDGVPMVRGEQADYVIDYGLGQITFTNKRLITNASRIVIDFEYSERKYNRTFAALSNKVDLFQKKLSIGFSYLNESDNEDKTIDFTLSDSDKVILKNAGNDPTKAVKSGVTLAGRDSVTQRGIGSYVKVDTLIGSSTYTIYRFAPGDSNALYNVNFSYVGSGKGDYISRSSYQYEFAGIGGGSYSPVIFLPTPTSYQLADITLDYSPFKDKSLNISLESAYSNLNKNKFSELNSGNGGVALFGNIGFNKYDFKLLGIKLKSVDINYKQRIINKLFNSLDRINSVEFNRNFDVQDTNVSTEDYREANLSLGIGNYFKIGGNYGQLKRGDYFDSKRTTATVEFNNPSSPLDTVSLPKLKYTFENISSSNESYNISGSWMKHNAYTGYRQFFGERKLSNTFLEFVFQFNAENRKNKMQGLLGDSLRAESFAFKELIPRIALNNFLNMSIFAEYNYRKDDNAYLGIMSNLSDLMTQKYGFSYAGSNWFASTFSLSIQKREYSDIALQSGNTNAKTVLVDSRVRISPFNSAIQTDLLYNITSERTAKIQKLFVLVPVGQGNYIYLGDLNTNGLQDENEFQLVNYDGNYIKLNLPTDQFFPTVDLRASARVYIKPSRYHNFQGDNIFADFINNLSTETILRVDEKSKDPVTDNLYYMHIGTFLNDSNTIAGLQWIQQDINLFENNASYSILLRYIQQRGLNQYSSGNERLFNVQRLVRMKLGLTSDMTTQFEYVNKTDRNNAPVNSIRNRNIISNGLNSDLTYRPIQEIESGLQINISRATDYYPALSTRADINQQILRFIYSFANSGRLRLEIERAEINMNTSSLSFPYELTNGRSAGKSYFWRVIFDYNITRNIQANINYDGRSEGNKQVIHTGKAQVTAFF